VAAESIQQAATHDPELDAPRGRPPVLPIPAHAPEDYRRLVVNPFLALLGLVLWLLTLRQVLREKRLALLFPVILGLAGIVFLLQYHCLDCGRTGLFFRWRRHACERVLARQVEGRPLGFRGPRPLTQLVLWIYALLAVAVLFLLVPRM
jgi:hypothetical protein